MSEEKQEPQKRPTRDDLHVAALVATAASVALYWGTGGWHWSVSLTLALGSALSLSADYRALSVRRPRWAMWINWATLAISLLTLLIWVVRS